MLQVFSQEKLREMFFASNSSQLSTVEQFQKTVRFNQEARDEIFNNIFGKDPYGYALKYTPGTVLSTKSKSYLYEYARGRPLSLREQFSYIRGVFPEHPEKDEAATRKKDILKVLKLNFNSPELKDPKTLEKFVPDLKNYARGLLSVVDLFSNLEIKELLKSTPLYVCFFLEELILQRISEKKNNQT